MNTIKQEWVRGLSSTPTQATKAWGCSASSPWPANAWFYSPQENRAVIRLIGLSAYWRTHLQYDRTHPVAPISPRVPIVWKDLLAPKSYSYARSSSTNRTRPVNVAVASGACCNSVRCLLQRPVTNRQVPKSIFHDRTRLLGGDRTCSVSSRSLLPCHVPRHTDRTREQCSQRVRSLVAIASGQCCISTDACCNSVWSMLQRSVMPKILHLNSNFFSFTNVPTPPSVHHHVHMC
jgi:hypothetical protein